jgi:YVTN family beta-propeller protein
MGRRSHTGLRVLVLTMSLLARAALAAIARNVYVANSAGESVSVIDTDSGTVGEPIGVVSSPSGIAITPDGGRAYVTITMRTTWRRGGRAAGSRFRVACRGRIGFPRLGAAQHGLPKSVIVK